MTSELEPLKEKSPEESKKKQEAFNDELKDLLLKHDVIMATEAYLMPDGRISSRIKFMDGVRFRKLQEQAKAKAMPPQPQEDDGAVVS